MFSKLVSIVFFFYVPSYISGVPHIWWDFLRTTTEVVTFRLRGFPSWSQTRRFSSLVFLRQSSLGGSDPSAVSVPEPSSVSLAERSPLLVNGGASSALKWSTALLLAKKPWRPWTRRTRTVLFVCCLESQQQASVSQGRICSDSCTCCHTET